MRRILTSDLPRHAGEPVRLAGWVHRRRVLKSVAFLVLRDRAGLAQVVASPAAIGTVPEETVVGVTGTAVANPAAPDGVEVVGPSIEVLGEAAQPPPVELYRPRLSAALPTLLDHAPVALRHPRQRVVHQVAAAAVAGFRATLDGLGFTEVHTPKIVASATESGANVFAIDYFGRPAYLAQSPQFYKQMLVGVFERVYEVGPVFRAEPHDTGRHLAQYTSLDAELGFVADHRDVMAVLREALAGMVAEIRSRVGPAAGPLPAVPAEIPAVHFSEAMKMLGAPADEPDLAPAHERWLGDWALREHGSEFLFVTGYPMAKRPFYTHPETGCSGPPVGVARRSPRSSGPIQEVTAYSRSFDLLFRGLELATGGQRLHRHADYVAALAARSEPLEPYQSYVDTFRYGMPPHGGFAIGLERFVARLTGAGNIRQTTLFPRDRDRLSP